jgi:hypothetical protein
MRNVVLGVCVLLGLAGLMVARLPAGSLSGLLYAPTSRTEYVHLLTAAPSSATAAAGATRDATFDPPPAVSLLDAGVAESAVSLPTLSLLEPGPVETAASPARRDSAPSAPPASAARSAAPSAAAPFGFRIQAQPQTWVASPGAGGLAAEVTTLPSDEPVLADSPPRRIAVGSTGLTIATLGANAPQGHVALVLDVSERGEVLQVTVAEVEGVDASLVAAAIDAAYAWRYEPARRSGAAVASRVRVVVQVGRAATVK